VIEYRIMKRVLPLFGVALLAINSCAKKDEGLAAGPDFPKKLQEALITAKPGAVIQLPEGRFDLDRELSLTTDSVTIRGKGMDKTVLSFKNQKSGSAGLLATGNAFTMEDMTIEDTKGDGIKINGATGVTIKHVKAQWTGGPKETNGSYGIYPVQCKNVLIEDSVVIGASDAGIYVGQSRQIIVRRNRVEFNVAGIEIENSTNADVEHNTATNNTGGLLVFNLPDLPVQGGSFTRVFENDVYGNNTDNFAPKGNIVAKVPAGTGIMVMSTHDIEIFKNKLKDNETSNVSLLSYLTTGNPLKDAKYDPFVESISIHDNTITGGGHKPAGRAAELGKVLGSPVPSIIYDGVMRPKSTDAKICINHNGDATFVNYDAGHEFRNPKRDLASHACELHALEAVKMEAAAGGQPSAKL
jgi:parallel beta-helix repeat protein